MAHIEVMQNVLGKPHRHISDHDRPGTAWHTPITVATYILHDRYPFNRRLMIIEAYDTTLDYYIKDYQILARGTWEEVNPIFEAYVRML